MNIALFDRLQRERVDLPVSGMTCAACARVVERALAGSPGVQRARVNLATNTATVEYDAALVQMPTLVHAIEDLGYGVPKTAVEAPKYGRRLAVAAAFACPVLVLGMPHGPVDSAAADAARDCLCRRAVLPAAWTALRSGSANMNTLIALGTGAAFLYSIC